MAVKRTKGKQPRPMRFTLHGPEKIGKSTFVLDVPNAAHFDLGHETLHLAVPDRWEIDTWGDLRDSIEWLQKSNHDRDAIIIDTVDRAEEFLHRYICETEGIDSIEKLGYGKGYVHALAEFQKLWRDLEQLQRVRDMHVICVVHSLVTTWKNPTGDDFDKYTLKLQDTRKASIAGFVRDQSDVIAFVNYETVKDAKTGKPKHTGHRVLHLHPAATYDAGCRYPMPASVPFEWSEFWRAYEAGVTIAPKQLIDEIEKLLKELDDGDMKKIVRAEVKKHKSNTLQLSRYIERIKMRIAERAEQNESAA